MPARSPTDQRRQKVIIADGFGPAFECAARALFDQSSLSGDDLTKIPQMNGQSRYPECTLASDLGNLQRWGRGELYDRLLGRPMILGRRGNWNRKPRCGHPSPAVSPDGSPAVGPFAPVNRQHHGEGARPSVSVAAAAGDRRGQHGQGDRGEGEDQRVLRQSGVAADVAGARDRRGDSERDADPEGRCRRRCLPVRKNGTSKAILRFIQLVDSSAHSLPSRPVRRPCNGLR